MLTRMFTPLHTHPDDGFGGVGNAFHNAAQFMLEHGGEDGLGKVNGHLPINYLLRHAIELYLKSAIVYLHRGFRIASQGAVYDSTPMIDVGAKKPRSIFTVHDIDALTNALNGLAAELKPQFERHKMTDWSSMPAELRSRLAVVSAADPMSAAFRYPISGNVAVDRQKSSFKPADPEQVIRQMQEGEEKKVVMMLVGDDETIAGAYSLDDRPLPELREALVEAARDLEAAQLGISIETAKFL